MWITGMRDLKAVAEKLNEMFPGSKKTSLHGDFATVMCFLADRPLFERYFMEVSDDIGRMYKFRKHTLHLKNALTAALLDRFVILDRASGNKVGCAFKNAHEGIVVLSDKGAQNITLTGNAQHLFGGIVSAGYLFKDATGPSHGEYAHSIQWLTVAYAKYYGDITLTNGVLDLYKNAVGLPFSAEDVVTLDADKLDAQGDNRIELKLPYWSFLVDCFRSTELYGLPEYFGRNLFVENYRSPSYLTDQMLHRRLSHTFLGMHLQERYQKRKVQGFQTGLSQREALRTYTLSKQVQKKNAIKLSGATTNATVPKHLSGENDEFLKDLLSRTTKNKGVVGNL